MWPLVTRHSDYTGFVPTNSANDLEAGIRFKFPKNGTGLGPGGKFLGRELAHE